MVAQDVKQGTLDKMNKMDRMNKRKNGLLSLGILSIMCILSK